MNDKIAKLPKWAQSHIANLERQIEELKAEAARFGEQQPTRILHDQTYGSLQDAGTWLRSDRDVAFYLGDIPADKGSYDGRISCRLSKRTQNEPIHLELMGSGQLVITPHVTNVIRVRLEER